MRCNMLRYGEMPRLNKSKVDGWLAYILHGSRGWQWLLKRYRYRSILDRICTTLTARWVIRGLLHAGLLSLVPVPP